MKLSNLAVNNISLVDQVIAKDAEFHPNLGGITRGGMANHFPMTVLAMQALNANDEQIIAFTNKWPDYRAHITDQLGMEDQHVVTTENWQQYLGDDSKLVEFQRVFMQQLNDGGSTTVVTQALACMSNSLPMGLFHPLIRLSFASDTQENARIADALAYMAIRYRDVMPNADLTAFDIKQANSVAALDLWQSMEKTYTQGQLIAQLGISFRGGSIHICEMLCAELKVSQLAFAGGFSINASNLEKRIQEIAPAAIKLYLQQPSLTTLHAVTACQGLAQLTKQYANQNHTSVYVTLWRVYWVWLTTLFIEKGLTIVEPHSVDKHKSWQELSNIALRGLEVHEMKMVFSCKWLDENIAESPLYKCAATKALGLNVRS